MLLLIDGYNLLHVSGVFGRPGDAPTLHNARTALLDYLKASLPHDLRKRTTIVFDAASAPPGLPGELLHAEIKVLFAPRKSTADELIADLLTAEPDPRHLTVVSSDHAVQRAARQRGAKYLDSDVWFRQVQQASDRKLDQAEAEKPLAPFTNPFPPGYATDEAAELEEFGLLGTTAPRNKSSGRKKS